MAHVEEVRPAVVAGQEPATEISPRPRWRERAATREPLLVYGAAVLLLLQVGLLIGFLRLSSAHSREATSAATAWREQGERVEGLLQEHCVLQAKFGDLRNQVEDLHHFLASKTAEDILMLKIMVMKADLEPLVAQSIARIVHRYAGLYGEDPDLILAIMAVESNFNPEAVSHAGAEGLMQVMPQWKQVLGIKGDLKDPETSVKFGLQILGFYKEMYPEIDMALTAYNRGPGPVDMSLMRGKDYRNGYAKKVLDVYDRFKSLNMPKL